MLSEHYHIHPDSMDNVLVQDSSQPYSYHNTDQGKNNILMVHIGRYFRVVESQYLQSRQLPAPLGNIYIVQVIQYHKGQECCCYDQHNDHQYQSLEHIIDLPLGIRSIAYIVDSRLLKDFRSQILFLFFSLRGELCIHHFIFCRFPIKFFIVFRGHVYIVHDIIFHNAHNRYFLAAASILGFYCNGISFTYAQGIRHPLGEKHSFSIQSIGFMTDSVLEYGHGLEFLCIFRNAEINFPVTFPGTYIYHFHMDHGRGRHVFFILQPLSQIFLFFLCTAESDHRVIELDIIVLDIRQIYDGIPQAEACNQQSHSCGNSEYSHKQSFLIPENIPECRFRGKVQPFPDKRYVLQQDSFSYLRRCGAHKLCRILPQLLHTGKSCSRHDTGKGDQ